VIDLIRDGRDLPVDRHPTVTTPRVGPMMELRRDFSQGVTIPLLQQATAKAARRTVQSERPGHKAGAFAFCGVRTAFCDKGLRARRSLGVGQRRGVAGCLANRRGGLAGLSLRASRDRAPRKVSSSRFPMPKCTNS
jgi:hypothetical protein